MAGLVASGDVTFVLFACRAQVVEQAAWIRFSRREGRQRRWPNLTVVVDEKRALQDAGRSCQPAVEGRISEVALDGHDFRSPHDVVRGSRDEPLREQLGFVVPLRADDGGQVLRLDRMKTIVDPADLVGAAPVVAWKRIEEPIGYR